MKNRIWKTLLKGITVVVCTITLAALYPLPVYAYNYSKTGASEFGTVTITEIAGSKTANGYSSSGGYRVTYTIEQSNWTAFYDVLGGYFLTGNQLSPSGGCSFAYHTAGGEIWQDGAIMLGLLGDGVQAARCDVVSGKVSHTFTVASLTQLPTYIAYAYEPAPSAYTHINLEKGTNAHVWYYANLKNKSVQTSGNIDHEAPSLSVSVVPKGEVVNVEDKVWSTLADITVSASDNKARPEGIRIYSGSSLLKEIKNSNNAVSIQGTYEVNQNGSYGVDAYDKLNNTSNKTSVAVSCIDREGPVIHSIEPDTTELSREVTLKANVSDGGCGLHKKAYSWNGEDFSEQEEFKVTKNGTYTLRVRDALGNESTESITISNLDDEAPEIAYQVTFTGKQLTYQGVLWSTGARISAKATDEKSGVAKFVLMQNDGKVLVEKSSREKEEKLSIEGTEIKKGTYRFTAVDSLGNVAETEWIPLTHLDSEAPVIKEVKSTGTGNGSAVIKVSAQDADGGIGLADTAYSFDGGKTWQKDNAYTIGKNGVYAIAVRDRLGQTSTRTHQVTEVNLSGNAGEGKVESDGSDSKDGASSKKLKKAETKVKATVSGNEIPFTYIKKGVVSLDDALTEAQEQEVEEVVLETESQPESRKKSDPIKRTVAAVLGLLFVLGCLGFVLYLLLFYLQHSCVLYELDDANERKRLCRLMIHKEDKNWLVKVPDDKLGLSGTGKYLLIFHPAFLKEEEPDAVIIEIDGRSLREKPAQEISVSI